MSYDVHIRRDAGEPLSYDDWEQLLAGDSDLQRTGPLSAVKDAGNMDVQVHFREGLLVVEATNEHGLLAAAKWAHRLSATAVGMDGEVIVEG